MESGDNINFQTPIKYCEMMVSMLPTNCIRVLEPTPGAGNLVGAIEATGRRVTAPVNFWSVYDTFDAIVMNPPFSPMTLAYKILYRCMEMTPYIVALMPWLTLINSERRTKLISDYGLKSVTHLPRSAFPGARIQCCVLELVQDWQGATELKFAT